MKTVTRQLQLIHFAILEESQIKPKTIKNQTKSIIWGGGGQKKERSTKSVARKNRFEVAKEWRET